MMGIRKLRSTQQLTAALSLGVALSQRPNGRTALPVLFYHVTWDNVTNGTKSPWIKRAILLDNHVVGLERTQGGMELFDANVQLSVKISSRDSRALIDPCHQSLLQTTVPR